MNKISVYMITYNNDKTVEEALQSLTWADEIIVVDSFSTDKTVEIAQKYATTFKQQAFLGFQKQYQMAADLCQYEWSFFLDADEVVTPELLKEIKEFVAGEKNGGLICRRRSFHIDRWVKWGAWRSDKELRLYRTKLGSWNTGLHSCLQLEGKKEISKNYILHYTYENIADQLSKVQKYSCIAAQNMYDAGKRMSYIKLLLNPFWRFFKEYFLRLGFLDGIAGLTIAFNSASHVFHKQAILYELQVKAKKGNK